MLSSALIPTISGVTGLPPVATALIATLATPALELEQIDSGKGNNDKQSALFKNITENWKPLGTPCAFNTIRYHFLNDLSKLIKGQEVPAKPELFQTIVARDADGVQALIAYTIETTSWKIDFFLSAPWNVERTTKRCHGAGVALLNFVTAAATRAPNIREVRLIASGESEPLYLSAGFNQSGLWMVLGVKE